MLSTKTTLGGKSKIYLCTFKRIRNVRQKKWRMSPKGPTGFAVAGRGMMLMVIMTIMNDGVKCVQEACNAEEG